MANINRDYLVVCDVKKSGITLGNGAMAFNILDRNTSNVFINLVINTSDNSLIQRFSNIENAEDYRVIMNIVKPTNEMLSLEAKLHDKDLALFEIELPLNATDTIGTYTCELLTKCTVNGRQEVTTSNAMSYVVQKSIFTGIDDSDIVEGETYPLVMEMFDKLHDIDRREEERRQAEIVRQMNEAARIGDYETVKAQILNDLDEFVEELSDAEGTLSGRLNILLSGVASKEQQLNDLVPTLNAKFDKVIDDMEAEIIKIENRYNSSDLGGFLNRLETLEETNRIQEVNIANEKAINRNQDVSIACLFANSQDQKVSIDAEGNDIELLNSKDGYAEVTEIKGNTMVNLNKDVDKELVLTEPIALEGQEIAIDKGVDGAKVDVFLEGKTMVNLADEEDSFPLTMSYTVETGNHVAFQGALDGKAKPYITGNTLVNLWDSTKLLKSGDFLNATFGKRITVTTTGNNEYSNFQSTDYSMIKPNTTYTCIVNVYKNTLASDDTIYIFSKSGTEIDIYTQIAGTTSLNFKGGVTGQRILTFTTPETMSAVRLARSFIKNASSTVGAVVELDITIVEGDYSAKSSPSYFEGLQSSFEDQAITSLINVDSQLPFVVKSDGTAVNRTMLKDTAFTFKPNTTYTIVLDVDGVTNSTERLAIDFSDGNGSAQMQVVKNGVNAITFLAGSNASKLWIYYVQNANASCNIKKCYLLEGDWSNYDFTNYNGVLYKVDYVSTGGTDLKTTKTVYLNSPLLKGDSIEEQGNNIVHVHRYGKVVLDSSKVHTWATHTNTHHIHFQIASGFVTNSGGIGVSHVSNYDLGLYGYNTNDTPHFYVENNGIRIYQSITTYPTVDDWKSAIQAKPIELVFKLATPIYEVISTNDDLYIDSYANGHLDFDSAVPIEKVAFQNWGTRVNYIKPNTNYTVQFEANNVGNLQYIFLSMHHNMGEIRKGLNKFHITTGSDTNTWLALVGIGCNISNIVVTEATDMDFGYFKGLQSAGENKNLFTETGKVFEIKSRNKNLWNWAENDFSDYEYELNRKSYYGKKFKLKPDTPYTISAQPYTLPSGHWVVMVAHSTTGRELEVINQCKTGEVTADRYTTQVVRTNAQGELPISVYVHEGTQSHWNEFKGFGIQIEEGNTLTGYVVGQSHVQQLTHEPLRSAGDVKDRYVLIGGEWHIERNCGQVTLDGSEDEVWAGQTVANPSCIGVYMDIPVKNYTGYAILVTCDKLPSIYREGVTTYDYIEENVYVSHTGRVNINILKSKLSTADTAGFKQWVQQNPITIVYQVGTPTYEKINYNPVSLYSDTTYITTNSAVSANLKVKNHGFNALLKPSTTYTIASNLGVQTIVTGTDTDSLRLTGEGTIRDVRLFEGTVTDIPDNFRGIESAFEQHYDESIDKYKVKIKTVGKNLFDMDNAKYINGYIGDGGAINSASTVKTYYVKCKPNTDYTISKTAGKYFRVSTTSELPRVGISHLQQRKNENGSSISITTHSNAKYLIFNVYDPSNDSIAEVEMLQSVQIEEGTQVTEFEPFKSPTISFYLDEPLRGIGDVRDRVFVEAGEVKIERHFTEIILNGNDNEQWSPSATVFNNVYRYVVVVTDSLPNAGNKSVLCDRLPSIVNYTTDYENIYMGGTSDTFYGVVFLTKAVPTASVKSYLAENPMKVVYQLAEPTIETIDTTTLRLQLFKEGRLSFDSNIPTSSKIEYTVDVPLLNEVAEALAISDEQDMFLVDMATQLAVMNLTL